jgi:class 3 adenylate cyclase
VIEAYHAACARIMLAYEGFLAEFPGDGILAYFGYPRAHEDDAERTVRAALDIIAAVATLKARAAEPLAVRIGIATGSVVVGNLSDKGALREHAIVEDTPNLAARIHALAEPAAIVVAASRHPNYAGAPCRRIPERSVVRTACAGPDAACGHRSAEYGR